jgi:hypothetical protein
VILGDRVDSNMLSDITLQISQTGPEEPNLTIVDLPGLVSGKQSIQSLWHDLRKDV